MGNLKEEHDSDSQETYKSRFPELQGTAFLPVGTECAPGLGGFPEGSTRTPRSEY